MDPPSRQRVPKPYLPGHAFVVGRPRAATFPLWVNHQTGPGTGTEAPWRPFRTPFTVLGDEQLKERTERKRSLSFSIPSWVARFR